MIIYNIICENNHKFEGWFDNLEDYQRQKENGLLSCPLCNSKKVEKTVAKPNIGKVKELTTDGNKNSTIEKTLRYIDENFEDVGKTFADEAVKIYFKEAKSRNIRGTMTPDEEKLLTEEGVEFFKIPFPKLDS